jgi:hypothetical protein
VERAHRFLVAGNPEPNTFGLAHYAIIFSHSSVVSRKNPPRFIPSCPVSKDSAMNRLPRPFWVLWTSLVVAYFSGVLYVAMATSVLATPLQALPTAFWLLLLLGWALVLAPDWPLGSRFPTEQNPSDLGSLTRKLRSHIFSSLLFLVMAFLNNLWQPRWGGNTAVFASVGLLNVWLAFVTYRRMIDLRYRAGQ